MEIIERYIGVLGVSISLYILGKMLLGSNKKLDLKGIVSIIGLSLLASLVGNASQTVVDNVLKILTLFAGCVLLYSINFCTKLNKTIITGFIVYLILFISEIITDGVFAFIVFKLHYQSLEYFKQSIEVNLLVSTINIVLGCLLKGKITKLINESNSDKKGIVLISITILLTLTLIINKTPMNQVKLDSSFIISLILLLLFCIIGFFIIKQKNETEKIQGQYKKLIEYAQTNEGLLEEYRVNLHESKNQLILIDNMISKRNKEAHEYIASLIEKNQSGKYYWLTELKYVPLPELKGFMNFKIMEMINQGLNLEINISREIDKKVFKDFVVKDKEGLYSIVGVFLDNAREAAKESKQKNVAVEMYMEGKELKLVIANTYKGKIELEKLDEYGYSSKGHNRGTGLYIVDGIIKKSSLFKKETSILDEYFVQTLTIYTKK